MKKFIKPIIVFSLILFIFFIIYSCFYPLTGDESWCFGFGYNIANGLIPYKDFNMIITPFFPFLIASFLALFGKNIVVFYIAVSLISTLIIYFARKMTNNYLLVIPLLIFCPIPTYNTLIVLFMLMIFHFEKNNNDYIIGILLALLILTKQNVGLLISIISLMFINKNKLQKRLITLVVPLVLFIIYLFTTSSFYQFIDYTILGLLSFAKNNFHLSFIIILEITVILALIINMIKKKENKKDMFYLLAFQIIAFPICDLLHFITSFIPVFIYFIKDIKINKSLQLIVTITIFILFIFNNLGYNYPNKTNFFKYKALTDTQEETLIGISNYLDKYKDEYTIYILNSNSYVVKLELELPINKYDLINNGNMGYKGEEKYKREIANNCKKEACLFVLYEKNPGQTSKIITEFIKDNYNFKESIVNFDVYINK